MNQDVHLRRHGLQPLGPDLEDMRQLLDSLTWLERRQQGEGDTELMKLCCIANWRMLRRHSALPRSAKQKTVGAIRRSFKRYTAGNRPIG